MKLSSSAKRLIKSLIFVGIKFMDVKQIIIILIFSKLIFNLLICYFIFFVLDWIVVLCFCVKYIVSNHFGFAIAKI